MGKYVGYVLLVLVILAALEFIGIVDIPFLKIPDFTSDKKVLFEKTTEALNSD